MVEFVLSQILIPTRFYGFDSIMYLIAAAIGFFVSYYSFKLFRTTSKQHHFYLFLGFTILSMSLFLLATTTGYVYLNYFVFNVYTGFDPISYIDDFGFWVYYTGSLVAYVLFALVYLSEDLKGLKLLPIFLPMWSKGFPYFQILAFFFLSYVVFRNAVNFAMKKNLNSFLVFSGFGGLALFHFLLIFTSFSKLIWVVAHFSLLLGFLLMLAMLVRVTRK